MGRNLTVVLAGSLALAAGFSAAAETRHASQASPPAWHDDYGAAYREAMNTRKMLLILFTAERPSHFQAEVLQAFETRQSIQERLAHFVLARVRQNVEIQVQGQPVRLLRHGSMAEMHGRPGIAVIDLMHKEARYYGHVVSAFPFMSGKYYHFRPEHLPHVLSLPPGTITQRTMVWAVRTHPEGPRSTHGQHSPELLREARTHSEHQAQIGAQGHHNWEGRFHRIRRLLGFRRTPVEVVAESWPGQNMIDSCVDCVQSWRHSSGHWQQVSNYQPVYGYDIRRGGNGIWYGTGIFGR